MSDAAARGKERWRRVLHTAATQGAVRAAALVATFVTIPLALGHLGEARYGLWMAIASLVGSLSFCDLGIGFGLIAAVADADGRNDQILIARRIAGPFKVLSITALILGLMLVIVGPWIPWARILGAGPLLADEVPTTVLICGLCFLAGLPLGLVQRIRLGLQEGYVNGWCDGLAQVLVVGGIFLAVWGHLGLPWFVFLVMAPPLVAAMVNIILLLRARPWLLTERPDTAETWILLRVGSLFVVLQVTQMAMTNLDAFLAARWISTEASAQIAVLQRVLGLAAQAAALVLLPLWPAYTESLARRDLGFIGSTFRRSLVLSLAFCVPMFTVSVVWGRDLLSWWLGGHAVPEQGLVVAVSCWAMWNIMSGAVAMLLNGLSIVRFQVWTNVGVILVALPLKVVLVEHWGLSGLVWAALIAVGVCLILPWCIYLPRLLRNIEKV